jgi:predicted small metal-binding protein
MWGLSRGAGNAQASQMRSGYLARGQTDDEVIALILAHVATDHPDLEETETADDIRSLIELIPD